MNGHRKSDGPIVPRKSPNKATTAAEGMEGRGSTKGSSSQQNTLRTQGRARVQSALRRIRQVSERDRKTQFTSLFHHVHAVDSLREAFYSLKRQAAPGVDGQRWTEYGENLEANLADLSRRLRTGSYRAKPVRRVFIPKTDGTNRPLGVTSLEDKIVQAATVAVLNAVYEPVFAGFSYGFRPGRSQHHALDAVGVALQRLRVRWVLDADIRGFFDAINHECLLRLLGHKIGDRRLTRLVRKWLKAGVVENGVTAIAECGSPQGGNISPVLANIYLHYAYDCWVARWRRNQAKGDVFVVRYADDTVAGFEHRFEALRFLGGLRAHFRQFGLELHSEKTRILEFGPFAAENREQRGESKPETFEFLGFTHICGYSRNGKYQLLRKTSTKRMTRKLKELKQQLRRHMNKPIPNVGKWLGSVVRGHYQYYGVPLNLRALGAFRHRVIVLWKRTLSRRSHKAHVTWERMDRLAAKWIPVPKIVHPHPEERLVV